MSARKVKATSRKFAAAERIREAAKFQPSDCPPGESNWEYAERMLASVEAALDVAQHRVTALRIVVARRQEIESGAAE